ncbi:MAG: hypothetical protein GY810_20790 [Aureispira sp.]|nr:hypothetical protein [Aureispira sp.]
MTRPQKVILAFSYFISETGPTNDILYFLLTKPSYALVLAQIEHFEFYPFISSYTNKALSEFDNSLITGDFQKLITRWQDPNNTENDRKAILTEAEKLIPNSKQINQGLENSQNRKNRFKNACNYIQSKIGNLLKVSTPSPIRKLKKTEAIEQFIDYLEQYYGSKPVEISSYYAIDGTVDFQNTKVYLIQFKMPNGFESIGVTGPYTHHFEDLTMSDIKRMYKKTHKKKLQTLYYGWYLSHKELQKNASASKLTETTWEDTLTKLQDLKKSQIPVNTTPLDTYFNLGGEHFFIFKGNLLYNSKELDLPEDLNNIEGVMGWRTAKAKGITDYYKGEDNLIFCYRQSPISSFLQRESLSEAVLNKHDFFLYYWIGYNKLLLTHQHSY